MSDSRAGAYLLAFEEARRALEDQERAVNELRSRGGILMASAAVTTSFLGGRGLADAKVQLAAWIAIASFALIGGAVLVVLWPRHDWIFAVDAEQFIVEYVEPANGAAVDLPLIHRDLALHMALSYKANRRQLRTLMAVFRAGAILLVLEVVAWLVTLIGQT